MATAPHIYSESYSGPICGFKTPPRHRMIETIPEVITIVNGLVAAEMYKMSEITYYVNKINSSLKAIGSKIVITRTEYIQMINRFTKFGDDYIKNCSERVAILSDFIV